MEKEQNLLAAYLPFNTFLTGLDHLAAISIPNKIETSTFPSMSNHNKAQMMSALRFFDLIDKDGIPKPALDDLAHKKDQRKALIKGLIETHYPDIVALDFSKMTTSQLETALAGKRYNVSGDTRKKAKTFLLKAAQYAGYTPHYLLTKITRTRKKGAERKPPAGTGKAETNGNAASDAPPAPPRQDEPEGTKKTIQLRRGGSLTLSLAVNILELKGEDRAFVFELIDKLEEYEEKASAMPLPEAAEPVSKPEDDIIRLKI